VPPPPQWNQEKASDKFVILVCNINLNGLLTSFCICKKRKPRKNTTKNWFLKELSTSSPTLEHAAASPPPDVAASPPPNDVVVPLDVVVVPPALEYSPHGVASSPPRQQKRGVRKLTPKKKIARTMSPHYVVCQYLYELCRCLYELC
jgi:hypothetical protein